MMSSAEGHGQVVSLDEDLEPQEHRLPEGSSAHKLFVKAEKSTPDEFWVTAQAQVRRWEQSPSVVRYRAKHAKASKPAHSSSWVSKELDHTRQEMDRVEHKFDHHGEDILLQVGEGKDAGAESIADATTASDGSGRSIQPDASLDDNMKAYKAHHMDMIQKAAEDTARAQKVSDLLTKHVGIQKNHIQQQSEAMQDFSQQLNADSVKTSGELLQSRAEAKSAASAAHNAAQKVLQFSQEEDGLTDAEATSYQQGLELANKIKFEEDVQGLHPLQRRARVEAKQRDVDSRLKAITDGTSENLSDERRELQKARAQSDSILAAQKKAQDAALELQSTDSPETAESKMRAVLSQERQQDHRKEHSLEEKIAALTGQLQSRDAVRQHNQEMRMKLKVMEEQLNSEMLAHKLGLSVGLGKKSTKAGLKQQVLDTRMKVATNKGQISAAQEEMLSMQAKLAKAVAQGSSEADSSVSEYSQASNAAQEKEEEALAMARGGDLSKTERVDYDYGEKLAQQTLNVEQDAAEAEGSVEDSPDSDTMLPEDTAADAESDTDSDDTSAADAGSDTDLGESNEKEDEKGEDEKEIDAQLAKEKAAAAEKADQEKQQKANADAKMERLEAQAKKTAETAKLLLDRQATEMDGQASSAAGTLIHDEPEGQKKQLAGFRDSLEQMKAALSQTGAEVSNADTALASVEQTEQSEAEIKQAKIDAEESASASKAERERLRAEISSRKQALYEAEDKLAHEETANALKGNMEEEVANERTETELEAMRTKEEAILRDRLSKQKRDEMARRQALERRKDSKALKMNAMRNKLSAEEVKSSKVKETEELKLQEEQKEQDAKKSMIAEEEKIAEAAAAAADEELKKAANLRSQEEAKVSKTKAGLSSLEKSQAAVVAEVSDKAAAIVRLEKENDKATDKLTAKKGTLQSLRDSIAAKQNELNEVQTKLRFFKKSNTNAESEEKKAAMVKSELAGLDGTITALKTEGEAAEKAAATDMAITQQQVTAAQERADKEQREAREVEDKAAEAVRKAKSDASDELTQIKEDEKRAAAKTKEALNAQKVKAVKDAQELESQLKMREAKIKGEMEQKKQAAQQAEQELAKKVAKQREALEAETKEKEDQMKEAAANAEEKARVAEEEAAEKKSRLDEELARKKDELAAKTAAELAEARAADAAEEAKLKAKVEAEVKKAKKEEQKARDLEKATAAKVANTEDSIEHKAEQLAAKELTKVKQQLEQKEEGAVEEINKSKDAELKAALKREEVAKAELAAQQGVEDEATKAMKELKQKEHKAKMKTATAVAVERAKLDAVTEKLPTLRLELREVKPGSDKATKATAEAENDVSRLQRLNQITKTQIIQLQGKNDILKKRVSAAEQKYAVEVAGVSKLNKKASDLRSASQRLKQRIKMLQDSTTKVDDSAAEAKREKAQLDAKMAQMESSLSPTQLKEKEDQEKQKLEELRKEAAEKDAEAEKAKDAIEEPGLRQDWSLVHV